MMSGWGYVDIEIRSNLSVFTDNNDFDRRIGAISWCIGVGPGGGGLCGY
jgi:hypothetical protein